MIVEFLSAYIGDSLAYFSWTLMKVLMILIPVTFLIAIAFAFPMYLFMRERRLEQIKAQN